MRAYMRDLDRAPRSGSSAAINATRELQVRKGWQLPPTVVPGVSIPSRDHVIPRRPSRAVKTFLLCWVLTVHVGRAPCMGATSAMDEALVEPARKADRAAMLRRAAAPFAGGGRCVYDLL